MKPRAITRFTHVGLAMASLMIASGVVEAAPVTLYFAGTVNSVNIGLATQFAPDQTLTGSYTFDSVTPAIAGSTSSSATYNALTALNFTINGYTGSLTRAAGGPEIEIYNNFHGSDGYEVTNYYSGLTGNRVNGFVLSNFALFLNDPTQTAFNTALSLPTTVDLSHFSIQNFDLIFFNANNAEEEQMVTGVINQIADHPIVVQPIPEPCTLALFGAGLVGLTLRRPRRS